MDANKARELLERYNQGLCTAEEKRLVEAWEEELEASGDEITNVPRMKDWQEAVHARLMERIGEEKADLAPVTVHRVHFMRRWGWAAAAILLIGLVTYLLTGENGTPAPEQAAVVQDIAPGRSGAILTLADGTQVELDSLGNGLIASQQGVDVKLENGEVAYDDADQSAKELIYNTMTTPKGRQFRLTLPDGTKVWLNAASSLRFPMVFLGADRTVEVTGEAYFEVAKDDRKPFNVVVNQTATVQVLGTHFNINAYSNEPVMQTTLLEGSLAVLHGNRRALLKPGQQARLEPEKENGLTVTADVDLDKVIAWKNGIFNFEGAKLAEFLQQVERWYDIDVVYEKGVPDMTFWGKMTRDIPLSGLLVVLEKSNVKFRLEGRKLTILP
ncbi:FecR family protein [Chitinophaga sp. XS-30]|uniref:FecR family protein n=1 Tax=Chitinophaga sp. XS-30 TaxID=2604421 RepID=UPI0011DD69B2|nr:FecR family protein [Chitinophaga sp. XS-30]QEH43293.1 DUF4974 domain-containing protein [Chitinophaga sp. XS-30]